jgi:hypothetical protein
MVKNGKDGKRMISTTIRFKQESVRKWLATLSIFFPSFFAIYDGNSDSNFDANRSTDAVVRIVPAEIEKHFQTSTNFFQLLSDISIEVPWSNCDKHGLTREMEIMVSVYLLKIDLTKQIDHERFVDKIKYYVDQVRDQLSTYFFPDLVDLIINTF